MGLQVRLSHALGSRLIELQDRSADVPVTVGRARDAVVQVPSASVAPTHCLLFVHDGRWVLEDGGAPAGTYVNGQRIEQSVFVAPGDVISLGTGKDSPRLEIDPLKTARAMPRPAPAAVPPVAEVAAAVEPDAPAAPADADDWVGLDQGDAARSGYRRRVRRAKRPDSGNTVLLGGLLAGVILVIGGIIIYNMSHRPQPRPRPQAAAPRPVAPPQQSIFDFGDDGASKAPAQRPPAHPGAKPPVPAPTPSPTEDGGGTTAADPTPPTAGDNNQGGEEAGASTGAPQPAEDPAFAEMRSTPEWRELLEQRVTARPANVIFVIEEYRRQHEKHPPELDAYEQESLDKLWWDRIDELCGERKQRQGNIDDIDRKLTDENRPDVAQQLKKQRQAEQDRITSAEEDLKAMCYTTKAALARYDTDALAAQRAARDAKVYDAWKKQVVNSIVRRRVPPWVSSR